MILKLTVSYSVFLLVISVMGGENIDPHLKGFDDSILFKINWPGKEGVGSEVFDFPEFQQMTVTTENDEKYRCLIPQLKEREKNFSEKYNGPNPLDLLSPLFKQSSCAHKANQNALLDMKGPADLIFFSSNFLKRDT